MKGLQKERLLMDSLPKVKYYQKFKTSLICTAFIGSLSANQVHAKATEGIVLSGEIKQGGLVVGKTEPQNTVTLNGNKLMVSSQGDYTFGFSRDDEQTYQLVIINKNGDRVEKSLTPEKRTYNIQRIEGIKKSIMQPNPEAIARAKQDSKQVKQARKTASSLAFFIMVFLKTLILE